MKKIIIIEHKQRSWNIYDVQIMEGGKIIEQFIVSKFYEITAKWFIIYQAVGVPGTGYKKGKINRRINISKMEIETREIQDSRTPGND